jgi:hypothetical protein
MIAVKKMKKSIQGPLRRMHVTGFADGESSFQLNFVRQKNKLGFSVVNPPFGGVDTQSYYILKIKLF